MESPQGQSSVAERVDSTGQNLAALGEAQPALAERLAAVEIPPSVQAVIGRDGAPNYIVTEDDGTRCWFGGSSMPAISAAALVESLEGSGGSVLLPRVMTGLEARQLAEKLDGHCAVFVFEPDPLNLRLALSICDWSALIAAGRLVLLTGDDLEAALVAAFRDQPGYEFPTRMMLPPGLDPVRRQNMKAALASAGQTVAAGQAALADTLSAELRRRRHFPLDGSPRIVITTVDARPEVIAYARALEETARSLGWAAATCLPDSPSRCHAVARLRAVHAHKADLVLAVNCFPGRLEPWLSDAHPTVGWFLPTAAVQAAFREGVPRRSLSLAATPLLRRQLLDGGVPPQSVDLLEVGADARTFHPLEPDDPEVQAHRCDAAVLCDVADLANEAAYVSLQSHVRLFRALVQSGAGWVVRYEPSQAPAVLSEAERRSDVRLTEESIRDSFVRLIQQVIAPTLVARFSVERLVRAGLRVRVWGRGWSLPAAWGSVVQGPMPAPPERNKIINAAGVVLCPFYADATPQTVLDAVAAGRRVLYRRPPEPLEKAHPQLAAVLKAVPCYSRLNELPRLATRLLAEPASGGSRVDTARRAVLAEHTLACRTERLRELARRFFAPRRAGNGKLKMEN